MTEPKKYKKGKRTYTKWGSKFEEVRIQGKTKGEPTSEPVSVKVDMDSQMETGVYANGALIHRTQFENILDFIFIPPHQQKGRLRSRVILSDKQLKSLYKMIKEIVQSE